LAHVCAGLSYADQYAAAAEVVTRAREEARRRGWVTWFAAASQLRARVRQWTGPIPDVIADATTAVDIYSSGHHLYLPAAAYCLARGLIDADDLTEAESVLERVEREDPPRGVFAAWHHEARGRLAAATGQWERALEEFRACGKRAMDVLVSNPALFHWRSEAGAAALRVGQEALARELISEELLLAERFGARRTIGVARRAAAMLEDGPAREEALSDAAELFAACGARVELAETLVELGRAIRRGGRPAEARETLRRALALAEELGALRWVRVGRDELQRAGGRPPARSNGADALTPSERRVAELAAAGRTNREIANELFVTVKAVEWHLGNSYRKLDVRGRRELGGALQVAKSRSAR
jgi:DNA-binding CsgD family transcriptional regulator